MGLCRDSNHIRVGEAHFQGDATTMFLFTQSYRASLLYHKAWGKWAFVEAPTTSELEKPIFRGTPQLCFESHKAIGRPRHPQNMPFLRNAAVPPADSGILRGRVLCPPSPPIKKQQGALSKTHLSALLFLIHFIPAVPIVSVISAVPFFPALLRSADWSCFSS